MPVVIDTGIVTIYDRANGNKPLVCFKIDAKAFLEHKSGRWSTDPNAKNIKIKDAKNPEKKEDSGQTMILKEMSLKQLQGYASTKQIEGWESMDRPALVAALEGVLKPEDLKNE